MSLVQNIVNILEVSYDEEAWKEVETMTYVIGKTNWQKLVDRIYYAMDNPEKDTKVVLFEYNYTTKKAVEQGAPNLVDRLGVNNVLVHDAMYREGFVNLMNQAFCPNGLVTWYRRRRINKDGKMDVHRMQVVLRFEPGAFQSLDDDEDRPHASNGAGEVVNPEDVPYPPPQELPPNAGEYGC
jgi:hypothetical protein